MNPEIRKTEAEAVAEIARQQSPFIKVNTDTLGEVAILVFPDKTVIALEKYQLHPNRKRASLSFSCPASFVTYLKEQAGKNCLIMASERDHSFTATLDFHDQGEEGAPCWGEHTARLVLDPTPEWQRWIANDRKAMEQIAFAEFLEDNLPDIVQPESAALLDLVQNIQGTRKVSFKSSQRLSDGQVKVIYDEDIQTAGACISKKSGEMKIPQEIKIKISPFVGVSAIQIPLRLRIRVGTAGDIAFIYLFPKPEEIKRAAWQAIRAEIQKGIDRPVLLGSAMIPKA